MAVTEDPHTREQPRSKRILVTGGAGFIGSAVCRFLIARTDAAVMNVDALTYAGNRRSVEGLQGHPRYRFSQSDIRSEADLEPLFESFFPDAVMHLAAETHVDRSIASSKLFVETNVLGTQTLLEVTRRHWSKLPPAQRAAFRFLHVSTDEVYGSLGPTGLFTEGSRYDPSSPYSASKAASDHLVNAWHRTYGLPTLICHSSNNYGPFQYPEKLIPLTIARALHGEPIPVYGDGSNVRDWLYVEDGAAALSLVLDRGRPGQTYNVGGGNERSNLEVVRQICRHLDGLRPAGAPHERLITFVSDRPGHDWRYAVDGSKLATELGWRPREPFEAALRQTVQWYLEREVHQK